METNQKEKMKKVWTLFMDYLIITLGLMIYTGGNSIFIISQELVGGGVTGIGAFVQYITNGVIPVSYTFFTINVVLLLIALKVLGKGFGVKTVYAIFVATLFFQLFNPSPVDGNSIYPAGLIENLATSNGKFICCLLGGALSGLGIGMSFGRGGSTGGTDIIALMVAKYKNISPGKVILLLDIFIVALSLFLPVEEGQYGDRISAIVYGYLMVAVCGTVVDLYVAGTKQSVQLFIFSKKYAEIADMISGDLHRGVSVLDAEGWYSQQKDKVLLVIVRKEEATYLLSMIKQIDNRAFISMGSVMGVYGLGFEQIKANKAPKKK